MMHRVAVYGTLKKDGPNHFRLHLNGRTTRYVASWQTPPAYTMLDLGHFPGILEDGRTSIHTEIYEVSDTTLALLDELEGTPRHYRRVRVQAGVHGTVYLYVYNLIPVVKSGNWPSHGQPELVQHDKDGLSDDFVSIDELDNDQLGGDGS